MTLSEKVDSIRKWEHYFLRCAVRERDRGNVEGSENYAFSALNYRYLINRVLENYPEPPEVDGYENVTFNDIKHTIEKIEEQE
jgi:hypothetical protein